MSNAQSIKTVIAEQFDIPVEDVQDSKTFHDFGADELDFIEIVIGVEIALDRDIDDTGAAFEKHNDMTVAEFIAAVGQ